MFQLSVNLRFQKTVLYSKVINNTQNAKYQGNSAYLFWGSYLANHLLKFLQGLNVEELELLE